MNIQHTAAILAACTAATLTASDKTESFQPAQRSFTLTQAIELAVRQNPEILKQKQEIERTRGQMIEVRAEALPHAAIASSYNQQDPSLLEATVNRRASGRTSQATTGQSFGTTTSFIQQPKSWRVAVEGRQLLYGGGKVGAALRAAHGAQESTFFLLRETVDSVIAETRRKFYDVLLNHALIKVQEESVELLESQLKDQQNRFEAGTVPRFNVLQAEVALANARPDLIRARNTHHLSQIALSKTLGLNYQPGRPAIEAVGDLPVDDRKINLSKAVETAKQRRPLLKAQRQQILIEVEDVKIALAGYQPRLELNGGYELRNSRLSHNLDDTVNGWFFGVTGNWNIFDGLETHGKTMQARAKLETAKINYDDSVRQVEVEVQQAVDNWQQAKETVQSQEKSVEQALEAVRLARERLEAGAGTQLDSLNAQVSLSKARAIELQAHHDYNAAIADFERVTATATEYNEVFDDPLVKKARPAKQGRAKP